MNDFLAEESRQYKDSDTFRGFKSEIVDYPPKYWLVDHIQKCKLKAKGYIARAERYQKILELFS